MLFTFRALLGFCIVSSKYVIGGLSGLGLLAIMDFYCDIGLGVGKIVIIATIVVAPTWVLFSLLFLWRMSKEAIAEIKLLEAIEAAEPSGVVAAVMDNADNCPKDLKERW